MIVLAINDKKINLKKKKQQHTVFNNAWNCKLHKTKGLESNNSSVSLSLSLYIYIYIYNPTGQLAW